MSSQVNKSSTRFTPKAANRSGPGRSAPRRLSTLRASFSAPQRPIVPSPALSSTGESRASTRPNPDDEDESAIDDVEAGPPSKRPASIARQRISIPSGTRVDLHGPRGHSKPVVAPKAISIKSPPSASVPPRRSASGMAGPRPELSAKGEGADSSPLTAASRLPRSTTRASATALFALSKTGTALGNDVSATSALPAADLELDSTEHSVVESEAAVTPSEELSLRERKYDANGNLIIEPEDLPLLTKGTRGRRADPDLEEAISKRVINVETFTMAALCKDIPVGEANDGFDRYESARINRKKRRAQILKAKQMLRGRYEPRDDEERRFLHETYHEYREERDQLFGKVKKESADKLREMDAETAANGAEPHHYQPQLSLDKTTGQISVTTAVDRHENNQAQADDSTKNRVEVDNYARVINSYSFSTKERPERWTQEETHKFYQALSAWGTDFNLIAHMFPQRTRHQIKTKFKYEERRNAAKVHLYLVSRRTVSLDEYSRISSTPILDEREIERDFEKVRGEERQRIEQQELERQRAAEEDARKQKQSVKKAVT